MADPQTELANAMLLMAKEMRALRKDVQDLRQEAAIFNKIMMQVRKTEGGAAMLAQFFRAIGVHVG